MRFLFLVFALEIVIHDMSNESVSHVIFLARLQLTNWNSPDPVVGSIMRFSPLALQTFLGLTVILPGLTLIKT